MKVLFDNELGMADFLLPNKRCVLYVSECDIIAGSGYRRKLARYRNVSLMEMRTGGSADGLLCNCWELCVLERASASSRSWCWWRTPDSVISTSLLCRRLWRLTLA